MNLKYMKVKRFEMGYKKKNTFSPYSIFFYAKDRQIIGLFTDMIFSSFFLFFNKTEMQSYKMFTNECTWLTFTNSLYEHDKK